MKLNATTEMIPVTWPEFGALHPFAPSAQAAGYHAMFATLEKWAADITGYDAVYATAEFRRARRVCGTARDPRLASVARRRASHGGA